MNKLDENDILTTDDNFRLLLKKIFPNIKSKLLEKNINFCVLLENYTGDNIHGIEDFLDKNKYDLKGIKYLSDIENITFTDKQRENINKGKHNIGLKIFYRNKGGQLEYSLYLIIAKKKNSVLTEWVKVKIGDLILGKEETV